MVPSHRYRWAAPGDVNAFFGLAIDNVADLVLAVSLLAGVFGYPAEFALTHFVPGTAIGVVLGDLAFTWMAVQLARRTGRTDITAMPLGLDTPSTFGMVFFVLGPAFQAGLGEGLDELAAAASQDTPLHASVPLSAPVGAPEEGAEEVRPSPEPP